MADIIDISLNLNKKRYRIDGDDNRVLELDPSDLGVIMRFKDYYPKMLDITNKLALKLENQDSDLADALGEADGDLRACLDTIFDSNVSEICLPTGTLYDLTNGKYKFEIIIEALAPLWGENLKVEYRKLSARLKSHTSKYTK